MHLCRLPRPNAPQCASTRPNAKGSLGLSGSTKESASGAQWGVMHFHVVMALDPFYGQGWLQVGELGLAFLLSAAVGMERQLRGKSAGLRTQTIVGTSAALIMLVSKYGFADVLSTGTVELDPSRVAAQIVTGIGFLGAGLILTRRGAVHGLTTAASVWETAAIGMAAAAGLWLLALVVTALHFIAVFGFTALAKHLPGGRDTAAQLQVLYLDGHGVLRSILAAVTEQKWQLYGIVPQPGRTQTDDDAIRRDEVLHDAKRAREMRDHKSEKSPAAEDDLISVALDVRGSSDIRHLIAAVTQVEGVHGVSVMSEEELG